MLSARTTPARCSAAQSRRFGTASMPVLKPVNVAAVEVIEVVETISPEVVEPVTYDVVALNARLEARAKAKIIMESQEIPTRPMFWSGIQEMHGKGTLPASSRISGFKIRFKLNRQIGLGESFKLVGSLPEFGRFSPEVSPYLKWNNGHVWTYEARIRPGTWKYKIVLRRADGAYVWETGQDRSLEVPSSADPDQVLEININSISFPSNN